MATDAERRRGAAAGARTGPAQEREPRGVLATLLNPVAMLRTAYTTAGVLADIARSLPRVARALEQLGPVAQGMRELTRLRSTLERMEKLGGFLGEELPEAQHQVESLRRQLAATADRADALERQVHDAVVALRALTDAVGGTARHGPDPARPDPASAPDLFGRVREPGAGPRQGSGTAGPDGT